MSEALREYLRQRPWSFSLWRYSELVPLSKLDYPEPLLDLGCGDGLFARALFGGRARPFGVDSFAPSLALSARSGTYRALARADVGALPFRAASFATVFSNCVVEHLDDLPGTFAEVRRVLRPGGRFVFTVPSERFKELLFWPQVLSRLGLRGLARRYGNLINDMLVQKHLLPAQEWSRLLAGAGLETVRQQLYASPAVTALFDAAIPPAMPAWLLREITSRWHVLPKPAFAARAIEKIVGDGVPAEGGGLLLEARRA
jgi:SAM-dependent methyltransferase